jgi:hypothetical protein
MHTLALQVVSVKPIPLSVLAGSTTSTAVLPHSWTSVGIIVLLIVLALLVGLAKVMRRVIGQLANMLGSASSAWSGIVTLIAFSAVALTVVFMLAVTG